MNEPDLPTSASEHAAHDLTIVAALAARTPDLSEEQAVAARVQLATCGACTDLLADLVALQAALPTTSTPRRPRDFALTSADAARLRRDGWRRFLGFFGSTRDNISRPLAIGFTTLGLAGLLVAALPSMYGSGGSAILSTVGAPVGQAAPAAGEAYGSDRLSMGAEPGASAAPEGVFAGGNPDELDSSGQRDVTGDVSLFSLRDDASGLSAMFVLAGTLLIAGLGLFALRWSARRLL
jgi:hypothetical protein